MKSPLRDFLEVSSQPTWFFQWYEGKKSSSKKENGPFFLLVLSSSQLDKLVLGHNAPVFNIFFEKTVKNIKELDTSFMDVLN